MDITTGDKDSFVHFARTMKIEWAFCSKSCFSEMDYSSMILKQNKEEGIMLQLHYFMTDLTKIKMSSAFY